MATTFIRRAITCAAGLSLASCAPDPLAIPGPAATVTRTEALRTASIYRHLSWLPEERHQLHGPDVAGITVHTPDLGLADYGMDHGWWKPGVSATGMPYQWGGFDTPRQFLSSLQRGEAAGDISTPAKRNLGDAGTSRQACGIDCSGFVSRCWRLDRSVSTRELPHICQQLKAWEHLRPGDILLNDRHVVLFAGWDREGSHILAYEAGPFPVWRVNAASIPVSKLRREGYAPWRYLGMKDTATSKH
ncbi:hypothetical protein HNR46_002310 [Haloferula luteola]|uniref:NlpC/P60 family protein n=1 Tax=Haloferula luteola TaxID=595692 RepID=A0A840VE12_9BACT|nr:hypothetical protein [Haloferula luteola]MBB5352069.1 hypothetical protein [Haloferula luteola]